MACNGCHDKNFRYTKQGSLLVILLYLLNMDPEYVMI